MYVSCKCDSLIKSVVFNRGYLFLIKGMATLLKFNTHNFIFSVENFGWTFKKKCYNICSDFVQQNSKIMAWKLQMSGCSTAAVLPNFSKRVLAMLFQ